MVEEVLLRAESPFGGAGPQYGLIERIARVGHSYSVTLVAWGFDEHRLRLVLEGPSEGVSRTIVGVRRGSARLRVGALSLSEESRKRVVELADAIVRCHMMPGMTDPLESVWSSHRDLLSLRHATFFDGSALRAAADPRSIHWRAGGRALPPGWPPNPGATPLPKLLRIAAAILGVLPADRRCFKLFAHAARSAGHDAGSIAGALALTPRRVRQLWAAEEPALALALQHLADARLRRVP